MTYALHLIELVLSVVQTFFDEADVLVDAQDASKERVVVGAQLFADHQDAIARKDAELFQNALRIRVQLLALEYQLNAGARHSRLLLELVKQIVHYWLAAAVNTYLVAIRAVRDLYL